MAAKTLQECNAILAEFLGEKALIKLHEKQKDNYNTSQYLTDLFDLICESFPADFDQENKNFTVQGVGNSNLPGFATRISELFSSQLVLSTSAAYLEELENSKKYSHSLKVCRIITEILKSCSKVWFFGVHTQGLEILETSELEKAKRTVVEFLHSLLRLIDLMPFNAQQLQNHSKLNLYPGILQLCHIVVLKIFENNEFGIDKNFKLDILRKIVCKLVITCIGEIGDQNWILDSCRTVATEFLQLLVVICGGSNMATAVDLLCGMDVKFSKQDEESKCLFPSGLLGKILEDMKVFMANNKLLECPVAIHVLVWTITNVRHPYLSEHISMILPPLLLLVDDYRVENRVVGIQSLSHVIENVNATELCWYGRAEMIYDALHHRIHTNEAQVLWVLQTCLLKIIKVLEPSHKMADSDQKMKKCDENFQIILTAMEYESKILMRRAYCSGLELFINHMGIRCVKHFKRLLRIVYGYLEIGDGKTEEWRIAMLGVLKCVILNAWPRIPIHADDMLKCLMKLVIDISLSSVAPMEVKDLMFEKIKECLVMLLCVCGEPVRKQLECMTSGLGLKEAENLVSSALYLYETK